MRRATSWIVPPKFLRDLGDRFDWIKDVYTTDSSGSKPTAYPSRALSNKSTPVMMLRASAKRTTAGRVSAWDNVRNDQTALRRSVSSKLPTVSLTTDCDRSNLRDAAEKLPSSTAAMKSAQLIRGETPSSMLAPHIALADERSQNIPAFTGFSKEQRARDDIAVNRAK